MFERLNSLLKLEVPQIFLHDVGHGHAQRRGEVLCRHGVLFVRILQQPRQAIRQSFCIPRRIELYRQFFTLCHLPEVRKISTDHRHAKGTRQMRHTAAAGGGRIRHHRDARALEQIRQFVFRNVPSEFNLRIPCILLLDGFHITCRLRMIPPGNHESGLRELWSKQIEGLDHEFETLVRAPFPKGQNTVGGSSTTRKVGEFGAAS
jgi:hypothetical protein